MLKLNMPTTALVTRTAIVLLGLALFFEQAGARQLLHLGGVNSGMMLTPTHWISLVAPAFYLWAMWAASSVFTRLDQGDAFGPALVKGLRAMGGGLMLGAWAAIIFQPIMIHLITNNFRAVQGVRLNFTIENLTLALVGLALVLLARHGQKLKSKLESFV